MSPTLPAAFRPGLLGAAGLLLAAACASPPPPPVAVRVENRSGQAIESIRIKPCEQAEAALAPVPDTELGVGRAVWIDLPRHCVDLVAFDRRGAVAAEQRGLRALPGTLWSIY